MSEGYQNLNVDGSARHAGPPVMLLAELEDFIGRHRACGQPTGDMTEREPSGYMLMVSGSSCGVSFVRWVTAEAALTTLPPR